MVDNGRGAFVPTGSSDQLANPAICSPPSNRFATIGNIFRGLVMISIYIGFLSLIFLCVVSLHSTKSHFILAFKQSVWISIQFFYQSVSNKYYSIKYPLFEFGGV